MFNIDGLCNLSGNSDLMLMLKKATYCRDKHDNVKGMLKTFIWFNVKLIKICFVT